MRCTRIKKNEGRARVDQELTHHQIRFVVDFLHAHMISSGLLEWVGLSSFLSLLLWAFRGIVPHLLAFVALHLAEVLLVRWIVVASIATIVMIVGRVSIMVVAISSIGIVSIASTVIIAPMLVMVGSSMIIITNLLMGS